jgi:hypothetical protein
MFFYGGTTKGATINKFYAAVVPHKVLEPNGEFELQSIPIGPSTFARPTGLLMNQKVYNTLNSLCNEEEMKKLIEKAHSDRLAEHRTPLMPEGKRLRPKKQTSVLAQQDCKETTPDPDKEDQATVKGLRKKLKTCEKENKTLHRNVDRLNISVTKLNKENEKLNNVIKGLKEDLSDEKKKNTKLQKAIRVLKETKKDDQKNPPERGMISLDDLERVGGMVIGKQAQSFCLSVLKLREGRGSDAEEVI